MSRLHPPYPTAFAALIVPVTIACADAGDTAALLESVRTDSAGVEIVVNPAGAAVPVFATLDSVATLRLGSVNGPPAEVFGTIAGVLPLADGGVAILDGQAGEIRLFEADGAFRATFGAKGQGPGEFNRPSALALLPGDTLAAYDARPKRITRFSMDGALGRVTTLDGTTNPVSIAMFLPDGKLVGQSTLIDPSGALPGAEPTYVRDTAVLTLFTTNGIVHDTVDVVPGIESIVSIQIGEGSVSVFKRSAVFGRSNVFAAHPDGIWSSANDRFELRLYDPMDGRLLRIVRAPGLERPATEALAREIYDRALAEVEAPDARRRFDAWFEQSPRPETLPAYDRIVVDDAARLWVRQWSAGDEAPEWWVFARDGELLGSVTVSNGATIRAVRCGAVWGVERDEFDVSYVVRYALREINGC